MEGTTSSASLASTIYHGLQILAFNFLQTQVPSPPGAAPHVCSPHQALLQPNCWKNLLSFWTSPLSEGKQLISYPALFSKQILLTACNSPGALAGACNIARSLMSRATGREVQVLLQPEDLRGKEGEVLHSRLIYWSWTLDSYLQPSLSTLPKLGLQEECLSPLLCTSSGLYLKPCDFHEVISWHLAKYF